MRVRDERQEVRNEERGMENGRMGEAEMGEKWRRGECEKWGMGKVEMEEKIEWEKIEWEKRRMGEKGDER